MIGIDITKISRFINLKKNVINRILHENEINTYLKANNKVLFLAKRWAIKEALFKANNNFFSFKNIEIKKQSKYYFHANYIITTSTEDDHVVALAFKKGINEN